MSEYKSIINTLNKKSFDKNINESIQNSKKPNAINNSISTSQKLVKPTQENFVTLNNGMVFNDENMVDTSTKKLSIEQIITSGVKKQPSTIKPSKEKFETKGASSENIMESIFNNPSQRIPSCYRYKYKYENQ